MATLQRGPYTCGIDAVVDLVSGKWKGHILWAVYDGPRRFGTLKRMLPAVSEKMLIQQLRELEADGIVQRESFHDERIPRVEYSLTALGASLTSVLIPVGEWAHEHLDVGVA